MSLSAAALLEEVVVPTSMVLLLILLWGPVSYSVVTVPGGEGGAALGPSVRVVLVEVVLTPGKVLVSSLGVEGLLTVGVLPGQLFSRGVMGCPVGTGPKQTGLGVSP
jgi:hypothetical protein